MIKSVLMKLPKDIVIVHGGARGVDQEAEKIAKGMGIVTEVVLPDWGEYGKAAGMIRNVEMLKTCDGLIAFWDGVSRGTAGAINAAKKMGKPLYVIMDRI